MAEKKKFKKKLRLALKSFKYYSEHTIDKQYLLERVYFELMALFKEKMLTRQLQESFVAVDGGAGCGHFGPQGNIPGSPTIALTVADMLEVPFKLYAIEKEKKYFRALARAVKAGGWDRNTFLANDKCENRLDDASSYIHRNFGIFYFDLCGRLPMKQIINITNNEDCDNMDILIHYSMQGNDRRCRKDYPFKKLNRKYIISSPTFGRLSWRFVFATNNASHTKLDIFKYLGFVPIGEWERAIGAVTVRGKLNPGSVLQTAADNGVTNLFAATRQFGLPAGSYYNFKRNATKHVSICFDALKQYKPPPSVVLPASVM